MQASEADVLRACLTELAKGRGVRRDDLLPLLRGRIAPLQRKWGINLSSADFARGTMAANLKAHLVMIAGGDKFNNAVWVSFNFSESRHLHEIGLDQRRLWLQETAPKDRRVSLSTARRYLTEAIERIVEHLTAPDYEPVVVQEAAAPVSADALEDSPAPKPSQKTPPSAPLPPLPQPTFIKEHTPERTLQTQTFPNRRAVLTGLRQRFDMGLDTPDSDIEYAALTVKHYGGYGRRRQQDAAIRLAQTETGYFGLVQLHKTVIEMHLLAFERSLALVSKVSEAAEQAGRFDLTATYEQHREMLSILRFKGNSPEQRDLYNGLVDSVYVGIAMRIGPARLITSREQCVSNLASALHLGILNGRMNYLRSAKSAEELGRLTGFVDNLQRLSSSATPAVARILRTRLYEPSGGARRDAKETIWQELPHEYVLNPDGSYLVDPFTGERLPVLDTKYHPDIARGYWEQVDPESLPSNFPHGVDFLGRERRLPGSSE